MHLNAHVSLIASLDML